MRGRVPGLATAAPAGATRGGAHPSAYALAALKRVRAKLEGRGGEEGAAALGVTEQVEKWIKEATSVERLSVMYEGWTPWI